MSRVSRCGDVAGETHMRFEEETGTRTMSFLSTSNSSKVIIEVELLDCRTLLSASVFSSIFLQGSIYISRL